MPADDTGERTEQPTEHRRREARRRGNVARSTDLNAAGLMVGVALALALLGSGAAQSLMEYLRASLTNPPLGTVPATDHVDRPTMVTIFWQTARRMQTIALPFLLLSFAAALAVNLLQVGFLFAPDLIQPRWSRLNPIEGARRIVSLQGLVRLAVSLAKLAVFVIVAGLFIAVRLPDLMSLSAAEPTTIAGTIGRELVMLAFALASAVTVLAVLDYAFQRWKYERDLRMTREEIREELKDMEGDPVIRQRRREAHRKLAQARELQQVRDADVVITNPTHVAVALKYDPERMPAPTVVAKGRGPLAERIRRIAVEHEVPIIERPELARLLYRDVRVGQPIPVDLYEVFVEIMAYVYRLSGRTPPQLR